MGSREWSDRRVAVVNVALYLLLVAMVVVLSLLVPASETYP